jgi:hypothetical protein
MAGAQSSYVDRRFVLPAVLFLFMGLSITPTDFKFGRYILVCLLSLPVLRTIEVWHFTNVIGHEIQKQVEVMKHLPEGSRVYPMVIHRLSNSWMRDMHYYYAAHYATIYRDAFVPTIYAWKSQNVIYVHRQDNFYTRTDSDTPIDKINWSSIFSEYDYIYARDLSQEIMDYLTQHSEIVAQSGKTVLFELP